MRTFRFLNENKKDHVAARIKDRSLSAINGERKKADGRSGTLERETQMFKPQITNKSRNMAENYKKTFADVSHYVVTIRIETFQDGN